MGEKYTVLWESILKSHHLSDQSNIKTELTDRDSEDVTEATEVHVKWRALMLVA
jgi:hypothetical protein